MIYYLDELVVHMNWEGKEKIWKKTEELRVKDAKNAWEGTNRLHGITAIFTSQTAAAQRYS